MVPKLIGYVQLPEMNKSKISSMNKTITIISWACSKHRPHTMFKYYDDNISYNLIL